MADRVLPLDTFVDGDESIDLDATQALRITAIGTDRGTALTPSINGDDLGAIVTEIGDIHPRNTAEQGLLRLGTPPNAQEDPMVEDNPAMGAYGPNLYYYVPPDGTISFDGASGDLVRLQGQRLDGVASRFETSADETRFNEQGEHHYTFEEGSVDVSETIADNTTATMHTISPATDERVQVVGPQMTSQTSTGSYSTTDDEVGVFWELDGQRFPGQFANDELFLVDFENMPRPPDDTTDQVPFVWGAYGPSMQPLTVQGDQDLDINIRNVSGGSLGNAGDTSTFTYTSQVVFDERR